MSRAARARSLLDRIDEAFPPPAGAAPSWTLRDETCMSTADVENPQEDSDDETEESDDEPADALPGQAELIASLDDEGLGGWGPPPSQAFCRAMDFEPEFSLADAQADPWSSTGPASPPHRRVAYDADDSDEDLAGETQTRLRLGSGTGPSGAGSTWGGTRGCGGRGGKTTEEEKEEEEEGEEEAEEEEEGEEEEEEQGQDVRVSSLMEGEEADAGGARGREEGRRADRGVGDDASAVVLAESSGGVLGASDDYSVPRVSTVDAARRRSSTSPGSSFADAAAPGQPPQHVLHPERYTRYSFGVSLVVGGGVGQLPEHFDRLGQTEGRGEGRGDAGPQGAAVWRGARGDWAWQARAAEEGGAPPATPERDAEDRRRSDGEASVSLQSQESAGGDAGDPGLSAESTRAEADVRQAGGGNLDAGAPGANTVRFVASKRRFWTAALGSNAGPQPGQCFRPRWGALAAAHQPPGALSRSSANSDTSSVSNARVVASTLSHDDADGRDGAMPGAEDAAEVVGGASPSMTPAFVPQKLGAASQWQERSKKARGKRARKTATTTAEDIKEAEEAEQRRGNEAWDQGAVQAEEAAQGNGEEEDPWEGAMEEEP